MAKKLEMLISKAAYIGNQHAVRAVAGDYKDGDDARTYYTDGGLTVRQYLDLEFAKTLIAVRPGISPTDMADKARMFTAALLLKWAEEAS